MFRSTIVDSIAATYYFLTSPPHLTADRTIRSVRRLPHHSSRSIIRHWKSGKQHEKTGMDLILGAGKLERVISDVDRLLREYRGDIGYEYLKYRPVTPPNKLVPEDLAVTLLVNSRVTYRAFQSLQKYGEGIEFNKLPLGPLQQISDTELKSLAKVITTVANWPGFAVIRGYKSSSQEATRSHSDTE